MANIVFSMELIILPFNLTADMHKSGELKELLEPIKTKQDASDKKSE